MREITAIEIALVIDELRDRINGSFLRKIYDLGDESFRISFYKDGKNLSIFFKLLDTFNETEYAEEAKEPSSFVMGLRKRIENTFVESIKQQGSDRVIVLELGGRYKLIIEMFGRGNVILVDELCIVKLCYKNFRYKDREVRTGVAYRFPKSVELNLKSIDNEFVGKAVEQIKGEHRLITELSKNLNIGPLYLEDIIKRSGLDPKGALKEADTAARKRLENEITAFFDRLKVEKPRIYRMEGRDIDYAACSIKKYEYLEVIECDSYNELLDKLYLDGRSKEKDTGNERKINEINANIEKQKELLEITLKDSEYYAKAGSKIFENMQNLNQIIEYVRQNRRLTKEELASAFKNLKNIKIKGINLKDKLLKVEVE